MDSCSLSALCSVSMFLITSVYGDHETAVVVACQSDYFRAICEGADAVIVAEVATYGRMKISRCAKESFGYLGCSNDVLNIIDAHCSGRRQCNMRVLDENFPDVKPCHDDLKSYLEVSYSCVRVVLPFHECSLQQPHTIEETSGFISSLVSMETGCGLNESPWQMRAQTGQRFNISLIDFTSASSFQSAPSPPHHREGILPNVRDSEARYYDNQEECVAFASIVDVALNRRKTTTVCGGDVLLRVRFLLLTTGSSVEIRIAKNHIIPPNFLLHFEVVGCPTLEVPKAGWMKTGGSDVVTFGCRTGEKWQLVCHNLVWVGEHKNCSALQEEIPNASRKIQAKDLPIGVSITIVLLLSLAIWLVIITVGCFYLRRKSFSRDGDKSLSPSDVAQQTSQIALCPKHAVLCRLQSEGSTISRALLHVPQNDKRSTVYGSLGSDRNSDWSDSPERSIYSRYYDQQFRPQVVVLRNLKNATSTALADLHDHAEPTTTTDGDKQKQKLATFCEDVGPCDLTLCCEGVTA